jgi:hypothetical protein
MPDDSTPNDSSIDNGPNNCRDARVAFSLQLDGELAAGGHTRLAQHLRCCHGCRAFARELKAISDWLRGTGRSRCLMLQPRPSMCTLGGTRSQSAGSKRCTVWTHQRQSMPVRLGDIRRQHADTAGEPRKTMLRCT